MARTVRDAKLESRTARDALKASAKPYYRAIDEGLHLGYRKGKTAGKWVMRRHVGGKKVYEVEVIGGADDTIDADGDVILTFKQAQDKARQRFIAGQRAQAGLPTLAAGPYTVKAAIEDYLQWLAENRKTGQNARFRAEALILPALGDVVCAKLTTKQVRDWRDELAKIPPRIRTKKGEPPRHRGPSDDQDEDARRRRSTTNRTLTVLKAALNHAWREKRIASDDAWRSVTALREADAARVRYLTIDEARRLINAAEPSFRKMVEAALQTGARYGELAALQVGDVNSDSGTIQIRTSKSGKGRHIVLTDEGIAFFQNLTVGRSPRDRLLPKSDGGKWRDTHQTRPMKAACEGARIDPPANFHCLRHTYASLTIMGGAPLLVVAQNLGHSDTRMVEKHYGHLAASYVAAAIRAAAPRFGIAAEGNVVAIGGGA
jgi:integrase